MIPAFKPLAGFSPNCWAVLVQIEHWAIDFWENSPERIRTKTPVITIFFMIKIIESKNTIEYFSSNYVLSLFQTLLNHSLNPSK